MCFSAAHRRVTAKKRQNPKEVPARDRSVAATDDDAVHSWSARLLEGSHQGVWKRVELHTPLLANLFHEPRRGLRFAHAAPDRAGRVADAYPRCHRQRGTRRDWALHRLLQCSPTRTPRSVAGRPMRSMLSNKNWRNWRRKHQPDPP
jgi:hypothetical protein